MNTITFIVPRETEEARPAKKIMHIIRKRVDNTEILKSINIDWISVQLYLSQCQWKQNTFAVHTFHKKNTFYDYFSAFNKLE